MIQHNADEGPQLHRGHVIWVCWHTLHQQGGQVEELSLQERLTGVSDREELEDGGRLQYVLDIALGDGDLASVGIVDEAGDHAGLHIMKSYDILLSGPCEEQTLPDCR